MLTSFGWLSIAINVNSRVSSWCHNKCWKINPQSGSDFVLVQAPQKFSRILRIFYKFWNDPALWILAFKFKVFSLDKVRSKVLTILFSGCAGLKKIFWKEKGYSCDNYNKVNSWSKC